MNNTSAQSEGPVTTIISRKVRAGHEDEYEAWLSGIVQAARAFPGYLGVNVMRPSSKAKPEYVTIVRFESYASLKHWENSDAQKEWQKKLPRDAVESEAQTRNMSGLEFWFTAADAPQLAQPPRYKMALVVIAVVFCMLSLLTPLFAGLLSGLHPKLRMLVVVTVQVLLMTYFIMPWITKLLSRWLSAK